MENIPSLIHYPNVSLKHKNRSWQAWTFDRDAFSKYGLNIKDRDFGFEWKQTIQLRPHMHHLVESFYQNRMNPKQYVVIGIHARLTDKLHGNTVMKIIQNIFNIHSIVICVGLDKK